MPIQYLYPLKDRIVGGWTANENGSLGGNCYSTVNNGVATFNDSDYSYTQNNAGTNFIDYWGNISKYQLISFNLDKIRYVPSSITLNYRAYNYNSSGYCFADIRSSGEGYFAEINNFNEPSIFFYDTFANFSETMNLNTYSGSYDNLFINFSLANFGTSLSFWMFLSELEIVISGTETTPENYDNCELFIFNSETINSGIDLSISGQYLTFGTTPLYTSGNIPTGINDNLTLYTIGHDDISSGIDLFIRSTINTNMPLHINGFGGTSTQGITLFIKADDSGINYGSTNNTETLFIKSIPYVSGDCFDLYIAGPDSGYMYENIPLYIEGYGGSSTDATTLYIQALESGIDYGYGIGTSDLYLNGIAANSGDPFSLYISAPTSGYLNDGMPLYLNNLDAWSSFGSGGYLYLQALESGARTTTLYLKTLESIGVSGGTDDNPFNLYISGYVGQFTNSSTLYIDGQHHFDNNIPLYLSVAYESSSTFSLFTTGWGSSGNKIGNLYIKGFGGTTHENTTLYVNGPPPTGDAMPLYINGGGIDFRYDQTTLHTYGNVSGAYENSVSLHVVGGYEKSEFPLLIYNDDEPLLLTKGATLFAAGFSGVMGQIGKGSQLYINGGSSNDNMNLYLHNSGINSHYNTYPLYLSGKDITYSGIANWNTLYIQNEYLHIDYGCEMYLNSQEAYEESGDFNLFIARSTEAIAGNTNLYLAATNGSTSEFAMYISGATYSQNNVNLSIPYVESTIINNAKLYTHGF